MTHPTRAFACIHKVQYRTCYNVDAWPKTKLHERARAPASRSKFRGGGGVANSPLPCSKRSVPSLLEEPRRDRPTRSPPTGTGTIALGKAMENIAVLA